MYSSQLPQPRKRKAVGLVKYRCHLRYRKIKFWASLIIFFTVGVPVVWDLLVISVIRVIRIFWFAWNEQPGNTTWKIDYVGFLLFCLKSVSSHKDLPFWLLILRAFLRCTQCIKQPPSTLCIIRSNWEKIDTLTESSALKKATYLLASNLFG